MVYGSHIDDHTREYIWNGLIIRATYGLSNGLEKVSNGWVKIK